MSKLASIGFGLSGQATAVLAMLSELETARNIEVQTWPWYNCRERGVCLEIRASLGAESAMLITFGECRNSDHIFIDSWIHKGWFLNPPTIEVFTDEAYARRRYVDYGHVGEANLGNCMHQLDRSQRALECFRKATEIEPRQAEAHYNIATVLLLESTADNREVELQLKLAIDCDPKFADAYYTLGAMYVRKADAKNAKLYFEQFLKLDPKSIYADDVKKMLRWER